MRETTNLGHLVSPCQAALLRNDVQRLIGDRIQNPMALMPYFHSYRGLSFSESFHE